MDSRANDSVAAGDGGGGGADRAQANEYFSSSSHPLSFSLFIHLILIPRRGCAQRKTIKRVGSARKRKLLELSWQLH